MARTLKLVFLVSIGLSILSGLLFQVEHPHFWWERIPVFDVIFGLAGCILLVGGSKLIGHHWLERDEGYYND
jgi:hypothetical protein